MEEIWKPVKGFEGKYEVSSLGRVKSLNYNNTSVEHILKQQYKQGYYIVCLKHNVFKRVNRLVAEAFIPNPDNLPYVNHKDEDKTNNIVTNLEWCNASYNVKYGKSMENMLESRKEKNSSNAEKQVLQFTMDGIFVAEYNSASEAARLNGYSQGNISSVCRGVRTIAYNFIWRYKEKEAA